MTTCGSITVGQVMHWHKIVSNYGHVDVIRVTVRKVGKRVTIEVPQRGGGMRLTSVTPERLRRIDGESGKTEQGT
jgi:hypothetical protein